LSSDHGLLRQFAVSDRKLLNFVRSVQAQYNDNPFHSIYHAYTTLHSSWVMLMSKGIKDVLQPVEYLGILLAGYCHDIDHPGNTNDYESSTFSNLSLTYSNEAVLEHHHCNLTMKLLLRTKNSDILATYARTNREGMQYLRKVILNCILGTDMRKHFAQVSELKARVTRFRKARRKELVKYLKKESVSGETQDGLQDLKEGRHTRRASSCYSSSSQYSSSSDVPEKVLEHLKPPLVWAYDRGSETARFHLCAMIVHCSDVCAQTYIRPLALKWGKLVTEEFTHQARAEEELGLKPSVPVIATDLEFWKSQQFFTENILYEMWSNFALLIPELQVRVDQLTKNIDYYHRCIEGHGN